MKYLYTLPSSILIFYIIMALLTVLLQVINSSFSILIRPKKKNKIVFYIYNIALIIFLAITCGVIASVQRHLTEGIIYFKYYYVIRYLSISASIVILLNIIFNRSYKDIGVLLMSIILLPIFEKVFGETRFFKCCYLWNVISRKTSFGSG